MKFKKTVSSSILLVFFITIIPLIIMMISISKWSEDAVKTEIKSTMISQHIFLEQQIRNELFRMYKKQQEILLDEDLINLSYNDEIITNYDQRELILRIYNHLNIVKDSSIYTDNIKVILPLQDKVYGSNNMLSNLSEEDKMKLSSFNTQPFSYFLSKDNLHIIMAYPIFTKQKNIRYLVDFELSSRNLKNTIEKFQPESESLVILQNSKENWYITSIQSENIDSVRSYIYMIENNKMPTEGRIIIDNNKYIYTYSKIDTFDFSLISVVPEEKLLSRINIFQKLLFVMILISIIVILIFTFNLKRVIQKPMVRLVNALELVTKGSFDVQIHYSGKNEFKHIYESFNITVNKLKDLIDQVYKQKIIAQRAELKQLQSQINPHFLYNSFFIIYNMAQLEDYQGIMAFTQNMSKYYQFITKNQKDFVILEREYEYAKIYIDIQTIRLGNKVEIYIQPLPEQFKGLLVPKLILQPIIENAYKHGLENNNTRGKINISFEYNDENLSINIEDNGSSIDESKLISMRESLYKEDFNQEITGMINIHRRLKMSYGENSGINIEKSEIGGLKVILNIEYKNGGKSNG